MQRTTSSGRRAPRVLAIAAALGLGYAATAAAAGQQNIDALLKAASEDHRAPLVLTEKEKNLVLWEMRQMLTSVQGIITGLSNEDMQLVAESATVMGSGAAEMIPAETVAKLPQPFIEMANATHGGFDTISISAKDGETVDMLTFRLSEMLGVCVACHAVYRIEVK